MDEAPAQPSGMCRQVNGRAGRSCDQVVNRGCALAARAYRGLDVESGGRHGGHPRAIPQPAGAAHASPRPARVRGGAAAKPAPGGNEPRRPSRADLGQVLAAPSHTHLERADRPGGRPRWEPPGRARGVQASANPQLVGTTTTSPPRCAKHRPLAPFREVAGQRLGQPADRSIEPVRVSAAASGDSSRRDCAGSGRQRPLTVRRGDDGCSGA